MVTVSPFALRVNLSDTELLKDNFLVYAETEVKQRLKDEQRYVYLMDLTSIECRSRNDSCLVAALENND